MSLILVKIIYKNNIMNYSSQYFEIMEDNIREIVNTIMEINKFILSLEERIKILENKNNELSKNDNKNLDFDEICNNSDFEEIEKI